MSIVGIDDAANTNGVYVGGGIDPTERIAGAAVTPGAIVVTEGTTDGECIETADAEDGSRALGYALDNASAADPAVGTAKDLRTDYDTGDTVRINRHVGSRFMGIIKASSAALIEGDRLKAAASGEMEKFVKGTDDDVEAIARYAETADFTPGGSAARKVCIWGA